MAIGVLSDGIANSPGDPVFKPVIGCAPVFDGDVESTALGMQVWARSQLRLLLI